MSKRQYILTDFLISSSETLQSALQRMTQNRKGVLFVCDHDFHLVGVLTDGDVRRAFASNALLNSPVSKAMNVDPISGRSREEATAAVRRVGLLAVPVVGQSGRVDEVVMQDEGDVILLRQADLPQEGTQSAKKAPSAVAIIPARGGSKRVPYKNLARVGGKSLVAWGILAAKAAHGVSHVIVSTDDQQIAEEASAFGVEVPWLRPAALAQDNTSTLDVVIHALDWSVSELHPAPEFCVLLEPTAPLRRAEHINQAIAMLSASDADSVVSVCQIPHVFHPEELVVIDGDLIRPYLSSHTMDSRRLRGHQVPAYVLNGLVYACRIRSVLQQRSLFGQKTLPLVTTWEEFLDIDTPEDLHWADFKMRQMGFDA